MGPYFLSSDIPVYDKYSLRLYLERNIFYLEREKETRMLNEGDKSPAFNLPIDGEDTLNSKDLKGKTVVLYFYPKDDTSGCTKQAIAFTEQKAEFEKLGAVIVGVSPDPVKKHDKFKAKHDLDITLIADEERQLIEKYGVWVEKSMYGKKYMGVERSTFIINGKGKIVKAWRKVKVPGHVEEVLEAVADLSE